VIATQFQRLCLCFRCHATRLDWSKYSRLSGWVRNQRLRLGTGSAYELSYSAAMRDSNTILRAIYLGFWDPVTWLHLCEYCPMSGWVVHQIWRPVTGSGYIPQIYYKPNWRGRVFGCSPVMMLDAKNISISVGISLLSLIQAEQEIVGINSNFNRDADS